MVRTPCSHCRGPWSCRSGCGHGSKIPPAMKHAIKKKKNYLLLFQGPHVTDVVFLNVCCWYTFCRTGPVLSRRTVHLHQTPKIRERKNSRGQCLWPIQLRSGGVGPPGHVPGPSGRALHLLARQRELRLAEGALGSEADGSGFTNAFSSSQFVLSVRSFLGTGPRLVANIV